MKCRICHNEKNNKTYTIREMMYGTRDEFGYFQCSKCDCIQIEKIPQNISKYYPDNYYSLSEKIHRAKFIKAVKRIRDRYAIWDKGSFGKFIFKKYPDYRHWSLRVLNVSKETSILDVGCGKGSFLYSLRELGMRNVLGIDPYNEKDIEYENGLKIQNKKLGDVKGNWDIVMFHHSFEHLDNPIKALKTVARLMKPNGNCVIRTPIMSTYAWEHYEIDWVQLDAPRHFVVPSVHSMDILSEICGLKLENVVYDSTAFQFWASEQYKRDIPLLDKHSYAINPKESMFSKSDISSFAKKANELNKAKRGDQAAFYLKKI